MKNKIIGLLGIILVVFSILGYIAFKEEIKKNTEALGENVILLSRDIRAGEEITEDSIVIKKIKTSEIINGALINKDKANVIGKVAKINLYINEQVTAERITAKEIYYPQEAKIISIPIDNIGAISGKLNVGDYADIWGETITEKNQPVVRKIFSNIQIVAIKDNANQDVPEIKGTIATSLVIRLVNDNQIEEIKKYSKFSVAKSENQLKEMLDNR